MKNKTFLIIIVAIIIIFGAIVIGKRSSETSNDQSLTNTNGSTNYYGKADSQVTFTEYVDFQCEACYAYYPYVKEAKEKYKDRVRFQVRYFPITSGHQFAMQAARSAEAAALQGKFWEMHDLIFEGQKTWEAVRDPQAYFDRYAKTIGLDMAKFATDRKSTAVNNTIAKDLSDVNALGATGTPTFAINGKMVEENPGPNSLGISSLLDKALKDAGI